MAMNPNRQVFLDESAENAPPTDVTVVETEIEFLRYDGAELLWVRGKVCDYVRLVYQTRKFKITEVVSPRSRIKFLPKNVMDKISPSLLKRLLEIHERENPQTAAELLFHLTRDEFWTSPVSLEHAARFLTIEFEPELFEIAEIQRQIWAADSDRILGEIYDRKFDAREEFLRKWLLDDETRKQFGEFPLHLSEKHAALLGDEIGRDLRQTNGVAISKFPKQTPNKKIYARVVLDYFSQNTIRLSADLIARVSGLLTATERAQLERLLPQTALQPLDASADVETALRWATDEYLPFRTAQNQNGKCDEADALADSFAEWILENYPKLANTDREIAPINLRTFYTVKKLWEQNYWVLWVVVDGLSYPNHQKLLQMLGGKLSDLRVAENSPVLAVLPTITEKAKYGLTSGKFPSENVERDFEPKNNFLANFPGGVYAGNDGMTKLAEGLKCGTPTVCYWNFTKIDKCFHDQTDLTFLNYDVNAQLQGLADKINHLVLTANEKNRVAVVICSDHGQMSGECRQLNVDLDGKYAHGRTILEGVSKTFGFANSAFVKTNNGETVDLNPTSFRLSEPTTIALGSTYFADLKAGKLGVHGGLYPEEVVIGLAVLMRQPSRKPLTATLNGSGETGTSGKVVLTIDNPNSLVINPLSVKVENLEIGNQGDLLLAKVAAQQSASFQIPIEKFPVARDGEEFQVNGTLLYEFEDGTHEECTVSGKLICKSLYSSKNPSLLNRFKK